VDIREVVVVVGTLEAEEDDHLASGCRLPVAAVAVAAAVVVATGAVLRERAAMPADPQVD
jgi:hypothetical protein